MSNDELRELMLDLAAASLDEGVVSRVSPQHADIVGQNRGSLLHDLHISAPTLFHETLDRSCLFRRPGPASRRWPSLSMLL